MTKRYRGCLRNLLDVLWVYIGCPQVFSRPPMVLQQELLWRPADLIKLAIDLAGVPDEFNCSSLDIEGADVWDVRVFATKNYVVRQLRQATARAISFWGVKTIGLK